MAEEDEFEDIEEGADPEATEEGASGIGRWLVIGVIAVVVLGAAGGGWYWWSNKPPTDPVARPLPTPLYLAVDPPLITNFEVRGQIRFLQTSIEIMTRDQAVVDAVYYHMPVIRNQLLLLMNDQPYERLTTREGREGIRAEALQEVRAVLRGVQAPDAVEAVYFTGFVMQ